MTPVTKPVTRETAVEYRRRPLIATLTPRYLELREKGRRDVVQIRYDTIYERALEIRWRQEQTEKRKLDLKGKRR